MVESPQRIWIEADDECPYFYEAHELHDVEQDVIEYVRADLYAALEAKLAARTGGVKVKALEWEDADEGMCTKCRAAALGGHYELVAFEKEPGFAVNFHWGRPLSFWFIQGEPDEWGPTGPKMFRTLEAAKAAAQDDYERRILSTLEPAAPEAQLAAFLQELSGNTGELIDKMAEAIRDWGSHYDDGPWETLPEDRKAGWRGDAERALAVVKKYLTARRPTEQAVTEAAGPFVTFANHAIEKTDDGWVWRTSGNERICDWFGPSDFGTLKAAMEAGR